MINEENAAPREAYARTIALADAAHERGETKLAYRLLASAAEEYSKAKSKYAAVASVKATVFAVASDKYRKMAHEDLTG